MLIRKGEVNIFITDESVGIYQNALKENQTPTNTMIDLEKQIVENGYIKDPEALYLQLKLLFKQNNILPKSVNMTIHDQNLLIREFVIEKEILQKKSIVAYIHDQEGKTIHFPFEKVNIAYYIKAEDEQTVSVVVVIVDENLLHDYHDVFDRLGIKYVSFNVAPRVLYSLYESEFEKTLDQLMIVSLYSNMITINVLENGIPVFGMIEECEGSSKQYYEVVENYIERIANYYRYNLKKGTGNISNAIIYNFNKLLSNHTLKNKIKPELKDFELDVHQSQNNLSDSDDSYTSSVMTFAACINKKVDQTHLFNFEIDRVKRINRYANYLLVLAFTIFSMVAVVYIPYITYSEDINIQKNINNILQNQLETLREDLPIIPPTLIMESQYSDAYDFLIGQVDGPSMYIESLLSQLSGSLEVERYSLNASDQELKIVISATSEAEFYEYLIVIYEAYGITDGMEDSRWMTAQPTRKFISSLMMEVTITYA